MVMFNIGEQLDAGNAGRASARSLPCSRFNLACGFELTEHALRHRGAPSDTTHQYIYSSAELLRQVQRPSGRPETSTSIRLRMPSD
jgi:hypothetical protein